MLSSRHAQVLGRLGAVLVSCALLISGPAASAAPVDDYASYEGQKTCAGVAKPGTAYLLSWLIRQYPGSGSAGMIRACDSGGTSEHKDGRALDWAVDADKPAQAAMAKAMLERIFAPDKAGNPNALARRMGIMYAIWDDHIYAAYDAVPFSPRDYLNSGCKSLKTCSKTLRHRDHVHISLSWSGASAQTTFFRERHVPPIPVLIPGTKQLDAARTAVTSLSVPASGATVTTPYKLTAGTTYTIVGDGLYRFGAGSQIGDAACQWSGDGWASSTTGLLVDDVSPWTSPCQGEHQHVATYTPTTTDYLRLRVGDSTPGDNEGTLTFSILRADVSPAEVATRLPVAAAQPRLAQVPGPSGRRLAKETVTVPAAAAGGTLTKGTLRRGDRYRVIVTGRAASAGTIFDGNCVKYAGRLQPQHTLDLTQPTADHLSLYVAGVKVSLRVLGSKSACDATTHRYQGVIKAPVRGRATVQVWDPYSYADNTGKLTVTLRRL